MTFPEPLNMLPADDRATLSGYMETVAFSAGGCIFRAGSPGDGCYIIDHGTVRLEVARPEVDTEDVLGYLEAGALLGELSVLDRLPRSASAYAETDVSARRIPTEAVEALCARHPAIGCAVLRALGSVAALKLRRATRQLAEHLAPEESDPEVDEMVARAWASQRTIEVWPEERIDALLRHVAQAVAARADELAVATVQETKIGNVPDKVTKNEFASIGVLQTLVGRPGYGPLGADTERGVTEIASPAGVIFGIIPMTNPVATAIFKALISIKARNALILSFHRACLGVGNATGELIRAALEQGGAPGDLVQWVRQRGNREKTARFMSHHGVSLILATGGAGVVKAAYSAGTPALGVGPANTPVLICADAHLDAAAAAIVSSKSFDNGLVCGAEHNLVVVAAVRDRFGTSLECAGAAVLTVSEARQFTATVLHADGRHFRPRIVGQSAQALASMAGIAREHPIRVIVVPADVDFASPYAGEKLAPVLSLFTVRDAEEGLALCRDLLRHHGTGHTAIIHTSDAALSERFALEMPASRVLVNSPGTQGVVGLTTGLAPSLTLGCGTFGGNSTTDNVTYRNLMNIKRLAYYIEPAPPDLSMRGHDGSEA